jgi:hypothetical protein
MNMRSWAKFIDHGNGSLVVFIKGCRTLTRKTKFIKDRSKIFSNLGSMSSSIELTFCGGSSNSGL